MANNEDVHFTFTADQAEALAAWEELSKKPEDFANALWDVERTEKTVSDKIGANLTTLVGKYATVTAALGLLKKEVEAFFATLRKLEEERAGAAIPLDTARRQYFATQKIFDPTQQANAASAIEKIALQEKSSVREAYGAASALAQGGLGQQEILDSGSLTALLQYQSAMRVQGQNADPERIIAALRRSNQGVNAQTIAGLGAQVTAYTGKIPGFNQGVLEGFTKEASYSTDPQALGIYGLLRSQYDEKQAGQQFRSLFDDKPVRGERERLDALRGQLAGLTGGRDIQADYRNTIAMEGQGAAARVQESETGQMLAFGRAKGPISLEEARQRLNAVLGGSGFDESTQARVRTSFDDPWGPNYLYSTEQRADLAAQQMVGGFENMQSRGDIQRYQNIREQIMGRQEISVRIQGPDGRDVPAEPAAAALNGGP